MPLVEGAISTPGIPGIELAATRTLIAPGQQVPAEIHGKPALGIVVVNDEIPLEESGVPLELDLLERRGVQVVALTFGPDRRLAATPLERPEEIVVAIRRRLTDPVGVVAEERRGLLTPALAVGGHSGDGGLAGPLAAEHFAPPRVGRKGEAHHQGNQESNHRLRSLHFKVLFLRTSL